MRGWALLSVVFTLTGEAGLAEAPTTSLFPKFRSQTVAIAAPAPSGGLAPLTSIMPRLRGVQAPVLSAVAEADPLPEATPLSVPHPKPRPPNLLALASAPARQTPAPQDVAQAPRSLKGSVCGDPAIQGEVLAPILSRVKGCGVPEAVSVTSIDGVRFSQPAIIDCTTAKAFKTWIKKGMRPAFGNRKVVGLHIFGSYMCRSRNNVRGARISEHGRGKAIDVAGFQFSDGTEWTVLNDYNKQIRKAHKAACGIFGTTLGPGSDGFHENHLHFDTASYRGGPYCR